MNDYDATQAAIDLVNHARQSLRAVKMRVRFNTDGGVYVRALDKKGDATGPEVKPLVKPIGRDMRIMIKEPPFLYEVEVSPSDYVEAVWDRVTGLFDRLHQQDRKKRQSDVQAWVRTTFGDDSFFSVSERSMRFFEEAVELMQAVGAITADDCHKIVDYVFSRKQGKTEQEFGGTGLTLLALADCLDIDADYQELRELQRVNQISPRDFQKRQQRKADAGIGITPKGDDEG